MANRTGLDIIVGKMTPMNPTQFDELNIRTIAVAVQEVTPETGPAKILAGLSSYSLLPVVEAQTRQLLRIIRDKDFLNTAFTSENGASTLSEEEPLTQEETDRLVLALNETAHIGDAKNLFLQTHQAMIPIVDEQNRYSGYCASRQELMKLLHGLYRPPRIGGLATPLGVYMTSGKYYSGSGMKGLFATGALFALFVTLLDYGYLMFYSAMVAFFPAFEQTSEIAQLSLQLGVMFFTIMALIRLTPMSGLHAAEHMTINAIENGLEITAENVRLQPREHIRCGTNLMVLLVGIQIGWISLETVRPHLTSFGTFLYMMMWIFLLMSWWRPVGLWLQSHFTTKTPTDSQLESGMKAGRELLEKYYQDPHPEPGFFHRLWGSGILQMLLSFFLVSGLIQGGIVLVNTLGR